MERTKIETATGGLEGIQGKFYESKVFEKLDPVEVNHYNEKFPQMEKMKFRSMGLVN